MSMIWEVRMAMLIDERKGGEGHRDRESLVQKVGDLLKMH